MYRINVSRCFRFQVRVIVLAVACAAAAYAQTLSVLYNFGTKTGDPYNPQNSGIIAQGRDGNMYSTSPNGGTLCFFCGAVFNVPTSGALSTIYSFTSASGGTFPLGGLTLGVDRSFYGTTETGGKFNQGTLFKITSTGTLTSLYDFATIQYPKLDGLYPRSPPVRGRDGNFYGTTSSSTIGYGAAYKITSAGKYTVLYGFTPTGTNGFTPVAPLILGNDGNFYGTTTLGGKTLSSNCFGSNLSCGTVFKMTPGGKVTFLYDFDQVNGADPTGPLVQSVDGNFYGTTAFGGDANGDGVVFKITSAGKITNLHTFNGTDGKQPTAGLVLASDGNFYGVTSAGGATGSGTLFEITSGGVFTKLHDFSSPADGATPEVTLLQHTNGTLYADSLGGGKFSLGTFYSWDAEFPAFIKLVSTTGTVGTSIGILGQGFTGTTAVSLNGSSASFSFVSDTYITATVPNPATAGIVTITTPTGKLSSLQSFIILPSVLSFSPTSGKVGSTVVITGGGLTGASKVTFGGVKATSYTVNSASQITATVPTGAVTGKIAVTTSQGTATSSGTFTVTP